MKADGYDCHYVLYEPLEKPYFIDSISFAGQMTASPELQLSSIPTQLPLTPFILLTRPDCLPFLRLLPLVENN